MMIYGHFKEASTQEELYNNLTQIVEQNETSPETEATEPTIRAEGDELVILHKPYEIID